MNYVFISPHFPPNFYNFCVQLRNAGANVLGIGDGQYHEFRQELKDSLTDYAQVDLNNYDQVYHTILHFSHKYGKIDRVDSQLEHWLGLEAQIRRDFDIYGQKPEDLQINQSKLGMKRVFYECGVPCAEAMSLSASNEELKAFVERNGYPFIVKPDKGVGASNTYKVENQDQLIQILQNNHNNYVIEPFVIGQIVTFDGLVDKDSNIMFHSSFELGNDILTALKEQRDTSYFYNRDINPLLIEYGRKIVKGFNVRERFFHIEFFKVRENEYKVIEINVRPPGGYGIDMQNYSCDIDLFKVFAELVVHNNNHLEYERKYNVACALRRDRFHYVHSIDEVMRRLGPIAVDYKRLPDVFAAVMGNDTFILRHPEHKELFEAVAFALEKY